MKVRPDVVLVICALAILVIVALIGEVWLAVIGKPSPNVLGHVITGGLTALAALLARTTPSDPPASPQTVITYRDNAEPIAPKVPS